MAGGYNEQTLSKFMQASRDKKLSTRDRNFINSFQMTPEELISTLAIELRNTSNDLISIDKELANTKSPKNKKILLEERANVEELDRMKKQFIQEQQQVQPIPSSFIDQITDLVKNLWSAK